MNAREMVPARELIERLGIPPDQLYAVYGVGVENRSRFPLANFVDALRGPLPAPLGDDVPIAVALARQAGRRLVVSTDATSVRRYAALRNARLGIGEPPVVVEVREAVLETKE